MILWRKQDLSTRKDSFTITTTLYTYTLTKTIKERAKKLASPVQQKKSAHPPESGGTHQADELVAIPSNLPVGRPGHLPLARRSLMTTANA